LGIDNCIFLILTGGNVKKKIKSISLLLYGEGPFSLKIAPEFGSHVFKLIPAVIGFIELLFHRA
jgi:hypothetical protein